MYKHGSLVRPGHVSAGVGHPFSLDKDALPLEGPEYIERQTVYHCGQLNVTPADRLP